MANARYGNYDWLPNCWKGQDAWVVASGPSLLSQFGNPPDFSELKGKNLIVTNHVIIDIPFANINTYLDPGVLQKLGRDQYDKPYKVVTGKNCNLEPKGSVAIVRFNQRLSVNPAEGFWTHYSTGVWSLSVAMATGADRIFMLGFDGTCSPDKPNYYDTMKRTGYMRSDHDVRLERMLSKYDPFIIHKHRFINLTPRSAIEHFPTGNLEDYL